MADFSFSFDSDNPFAEPEPAPKAAPAQPGAAPTDPSAPADDAAVSDDSPFALDEPAADAQIADADNPFDFSLPDQEPSELAPLEVMPEEFTAVIPPTFEVEDEAAPTEVTGAASEMDDDALNFDFLMDAEFAPDALSPAAEESAPMQSDASEPAAATPSAFALSESAPGETTPSEAAPSAFALSESVPGESVPGEVAASESEFAAAPVSVADAVAAAGTMPAAPASSASEATSADAGEAHAARRTAALPVLRVAILGAAGIGKNHARWFHRNGCRVTALLGTSDDSTARAQAALSAEFPFQGTAYTDLSELLAAEKPDIVCVATPPALHFGHVLQCLEAGAHVLCEKPLVYAPTRKFRENRDGAKELVKVAAKKKLTLGTQLQYGAATPILCKLAGLAPSEVGDFAMELETLNLNPARDPRELWVDLGPHPVSVAQMLAGPGASLAEETIRFEPTQTDGQTEVLARFGINCADGRLLMVRAQVRSLDANAATRKPRRRFSFNGHTVIYAPLAGPRGSFRAQFIAPDGYSSVYPDPVDYLIGDFVRACRSGETPLITGDFGRENLEWMLKVCSPGEAQ